MKVGFIGAGNMGGALATAAAKSKACLFLSDRDAEKAKALAKKLKCETATAQEIIADCDYVFLGVKPQVLGALLQEIAPALNARSQKPVLVSMAAGVQMQDILSKAAAPLIRIMPNIPVSAGAGMILYDCSADVTQEQEQAFLQILEKAGQLCRLEEKLIDAGSAVSGCGPAFVSLFVEAMADGGVACGLPRDKAMAFALQTLLGTASLLQKTGQHPGQLKDAVCSPGGSTIAGVEALEQGGFRASVMDAVSAAFERTKELGK